MRRPLFLFGLFQRGLLLCLLSTLPGVSLTPTLIGVKVSKVITAAAANGEVPFLAPDGARLLLVFLWQIELVMDEDFVILSHRVPLLRRAFSLSLILNGLIEWCHFGQFNSSELSHVMVHKFEIEC